MSRYKVDYTGVEESGTFEPLPEGAYTVKIEKIEEKTAKSGRPLVKIRYAVTSGDYSGRKLFDQIVIFEDKNDKGAGITKHFLHVIEEPYEGQFDIDPDNWVGKELLVQVKIDPAYNNNKIVAREMADSIPF